MTTNSLLRCGLPALLLAGAAIGPGCQRAPAPDPDYVLRPSTWQGEMRFRGQRHPFVLTIDHADNEILRGRMEWPGSSIHKIVIGVAGSYRGNHLQFTETETLQGPHYDFHRPEDTKEAWIVGDTMTGTDKAGRARLSARRVIDTAPEHPRSTQPPRTGPRSGPPAADPRPTSSGTLP